MSRNPSLVTVARKKRSEQKLEQETTNFQDLIKSKFSKDDMEQFYAKYTSFNHIDEADMIDEYGPEVLTLLPKGYYFSKRLGRGEYGAVYQACHDKFQCFAVKIQIAEDKAHKKAIRQEIKTQRLFAEDGIAPAVIGKLVWWEYEGQMVGAIKMDRIDGTLGSLFEQSTQISQSGIEDVTSGLLVLLAALQRYEKTHGDMHVNNVAYRMIVDAEGLLRTQFVLIDFGFSIVGKSHLKFDTINLARGVNWFWRSTHSLLSEQVAQTLNTLVSRKYGVTDFSEENYDLLYWQEFKRTFGRKKLNYIPDEWLARI